MKKIYLLLLAGALTACSGANDKAPAENQKIEEKDQTEDTNSSTKEEKTGIAGDSKDFSDLLFKAEEDAGEAQVLASMEILKLDEGKSEEEVIKMLEEEEGIKAFELQKGGLLSLTLTEEKYKALADQLNEDIDKVLNEIITDPTNTIENIDVINNFMNFKVFVNGENPDFEDFNKKFFSLAARYRSLMKEQNLSTKVDYIDKTDGSIIESFTSKELIEVE